MMAEDFSTYMTLTTISNMSLYVNAETMFSVKQAQSLAIAATLKFLCY